MDDEDTSRILVNIIEEYPEDLIELAKTKVKFRHLIFKTYLYGGSHQSREYLSKKQAEKLDDKWSEIFE